MVRLTYLADMTLDVYRGRKTTLQQQQQILVYLLSIGVGRGGTRGGEGARPPNNLREGGGQHSLWLPQ